MFLAPFLFLPQQKTHKLKGFCPAEGDGEGRAQGDTAPLSPGREAFFARQEGGTAPLYTEGARDAINAPAGCRRRRL